MAEDINELIVSVKVGKSYKNRGWALKRASTYELIPLLPYEEECDIVVDGIPAKAHFNILPRIFYKKTEKELMNHLKFLSDNSIDRVDLKLLLNKSSKMSFKSPQIKSYESRIFDLENRLKINENLIKDVQNENLRLLNELKEYKIKYSEVQSLNRNISKKNDINNDPLVDDLKQEIDDLKSKNMDLEIEFAKLLKKSNEYKKSLQMMKEIKNKFDKLEF